MDPARRVKRPSAKQHVSTVHNVSTNRTRGSRASNVSNSEERKRPAGNFTYNADRVIDNGTFGVVYQATIAETGETVAIKKVF